MLSLLILIGLAVLIGYFLGQGKAWERFQNWYTGWRAPKEAESEGDEPESDLEE